MRRGACLSITGVLVALIAGSGRPVAAVDARAFQRAIDATVFVEVDRVYHGVEFGNVGTGFFLGPDGFIVTNYHVVGDLGEVVFDDVSVLVEFTVVGLRVVLDPASPSERVLAAKVVGVDRSRDLAVLKVNHRPAAYLELDAGAAVDLMDEVFVVGFPFGAALRMNQHGYVSYEGGYPEVSISGGRVTALRKDDSGRIVTIQTDAAINHGNSGGPMVDANGELVGVVYALFGSSNQIGFAISPNRVREFIQLQQVQASFAPPRVSGDRHPVLVTVTPGPLAGEVAGGQAVLSGADIPTREFELNRGDSGFRAVVEVPPRREGAAPAGRYAVEIRLRDGDGDVVAGHRYLLRVDGVADDAAASEDERLTLTVSNDLSLTDYARKMSLESRADNGAPQATAPPSAPQGDEQPGTPREPDPLLDDLRSRAKTYYRGGEYEAAIEILRQIVERDPADEISADYLALAREKAARSAAGLEGTVVDAGPDEVVPSAVVTVLFDPPGTRGEIRLWLDGEQVDTIAFDKGDRVARDITVDAGDRTLTAEVITGQGKTQGPFSFTETLVPGSRWTLRLNQASSKAQVTAFLVRRRG